MDETFIAEFAWEYYHDFRLGRHEYLKAYKKIIACLDDKAAKELGSRIRELSDAYRSFPFPTK